MLSYSLQGIGKHSERSWKARAGSLEDEARVEEIWRKGTREENWKGRVEEPG